MNILLVNLKKYVNVQGGVEKVFCSMANNFIERGYDVAFVGADEKVGLPYFPISSKVNLYNIGNEAIDKSISHKFRRLFCRSREKRHKFDGEVIRCERAKKLKSVFEKEKPDVVIAFHIMDTYILKRYMNIDCPVITMFHGPPEIYFKEILFDEDILKAVEKSECLQVLLPSFIDDIRKYIKHNSVAVIGNAIAQQDCVSLENKPNVIVNVGRVGRIDKRQHLLVEAFNILKIKYSDWKVEIYGATDWDVEYYKFCVGLVSKYELDNSVKFCGPTQNVIEKVENASIFAFPSAYEGFGLALAEAMSLGIPCVGFKNSSGVNELIKDGSNGILCEETVADFARGLSELMNDADKRKRFGLQAKEDMKQYAPEKIWDQWENLINKTVHDYKRKVVEH